MMGAVLRRVSRVLPAEISMRWGEAHGVSSHGAKSKPKLEPKTQQLKLGLKIAAKFRGG
jgi:hypothetical protein